MKFNQTGVTLIEMVVGVAVGIIVMMLAVRLANHVYSQMDVRITAENAEVMLFALDSFYEQHCGNGANPAPTVASLVGEEHLSSIAYAENRLGSNFVPAVLWGDPTKVRVSAVILVRGNIDAHLSNLGATYRVGNTLYWERIPRISGDPEGIQQMAFKRLYHPGVCL